MTGWSVLHADYVGPESLPLLGVVAGAGIGGAVLLGLALAAFVRRRSRPYLLIVAAILALFGRSVVAGLTVGNVLSPATHHVLEHGLDVLLVALVVAAVYYARTVTTEVDSNP
jgi:heme A synthase